MSEYNEKICPNCHETNDLDADHCYWCKYKFDYYSHRCEHCSKIVSNVSKDGFCPNCQSSWICLKLLAILLSAIIPFFIFFSTFITDSSQSFALFALILWAILYFIFRQILYSVFDRFRTPPQSTKEKASEAFSDNNLSNIPVLFSDIPSDNDIESETQDKFSCNYCHRTMAAHEAVDVDGECFCKRCYRKKWWLYTLFSFIDFLLFGVIPIITFVLGYSFVAAASIIAFIFFSIFFKSIINSIMNHTKEYQSKEISPELDKIKKKLDNIEASHKTNKSAYNSAQQPTSEDLEQEYNEFLNKTITIKKECKDIIDAKRKKYEINVEHIKQRKRKTTIGLAIIMAICILVLTFVIGTYFLPSFGSYQREELTNGQDVVCYVTNTGDCYHKISCGYLRSVNKTTMYQAEMSGYRPCSFCWNSPKAIYSTVTKINYFQKYGTIFAVLTCVFLIIFCIIYKKEDKKIKVKIENEKSNFNKYKELLLAKVIDKLGLESDFDNNAKIFSGVPFDVEYHDGLPIAKDDRFKVYRSYYGKSYHKNPVCRGNNLLYELHIFQAMNYLCPCHFCATKIEIPIWHKKYIDLHNLYKDILDMCK